MKSYETLPAGYTPAVQLDLLHNRRQMIIVNVLNIVIMLGMIAAARPGHPITLPPADMGSFFLKTGVCMVGMLLYFVLHELVHGLVIMLCGAKPFYGFRTLYAYAGSHAYFSRGAYIIVALAPVIVWGVVLAVLVSRVPAGWFWVVYFIQVINIGGAAGDYYVTYRILRMPAETLVQDTGIEMTFYTRA